MKKKIFFVLLMVTGFMPAIAVAQEDELGDEGDQSLGTSHSVGSVSSRLVPIEDRWYASFAPGGAWISDPGTTTSIGFFDLELGALKVNRNQIYGFAGTLGFGDGGLQMVTAGGLYGLGDLTGIVHFVFVGRAGLLRLPNYKDEYGLVTRIGAGIFGGWSLMQFGATVENVCVWFIDYGDRPADAAKGIAFNIHASYSF